MRACQCLCLLVESFQAEGMSVCLSVGLFDWLHVCTFVCRSVCRPFKATSRGMDEGGFHGGVLHLACLFQFVWPLFSWTSFHFLSACGLLYHVK